MWIRYFGDKDFPGVDLWIMDIIIIIYSPDVSWSSRWRKLVATPQLCH